MISVTKSVIINSNTYLMRTDLGNLGNDAI